MQFCFFNLLCCFFSGFLRFYVLMKQFFVFAVWSVINFRDASCCMMVLCWQFYGCSQLL